LSDTNRMPWLSWVQCGLAFAALVLAVLVFSRANANRDLQSTVTRNLAQAARASALANLDNQLIQLTAKSALDNNDAALTSLLAQNGVTFRKAPTATPQTTGVNP
jgi:hypothetical protein